MENLALASAALPVKTSNSSSLFSLRHTSYSLPLNGRKSVSSSRRIFASNSTTQGSSNGNSPSNQISGKRVNIKKVHAFSSISTSNAGKETTSVGVSPQYPIASPPTSIGSPLFWVGVGVGISALFTWAAGFLKKYAMQHAFKTMMDQMGSENSQFSSSGFGTGSQFPVQTPTTPATTFSYPTPVSPQSSVTIDVPSTNVEQSPAADVRTDPVETKQSKRYTFVDISPEELAEKEASRSTTFEVSPNGALPRVDYGSTDKSSKSSRKPGSLSVEALEKMMEDPAVQKMVYPYLPEEMRNPSTFKWMMQNPQYRQQLEDMLNNMGGGGGSEWDNQMMDSLKNFDLSSPEVKQQFDQIGLTPEEVISKIMANPEVAMAFQNPKVQAAIIDCSQNPMNITKYQNDKEVMDVFNKISELFPGMSGPP